MAAACRCLPALTVTLAPPLLTPTHLLLQFTKLNQFFREEKRQREGGEPAGHGHGGGH